MPSQSDSIEAGEDLTRETSHKPRHALSGSEILLLGLGSVSAAALLAVLLAGF